MMCITLKTSNPGEFYRDRGSSTAVMERLLCTCPQGGTVIQAATAARAAGLRTEYGVLCVLIRLIREAIQRGDSHVVELANTLANDIWDEGFMSCHIPRFREIIAKFLNLPRRKAA